MLLAMTLSLTSCNKAAEDSYSSASVEQTTEQPQEISPYPHGEMPCSVTVQIAPLSGHVFVIEDQNKEG